MIYKIYLIFVKPSMLIFNDHDSCNIVEYRSWLYNGCLSRLNNAR